MKKIFCTTLTVLICYSVFSQTTESLTKEAAKDLKEDGYKINTKVFKFGASLGFNYLTEKMYDPILSPVDYSLELQLINPVSFLISTTVTINPISSYYRKLDDDGVADGDIYSVNSKLSFIATVNLAQFGASQTATFNKKIDGGIGFGIRLNDDFHVAFTAEMISVRQLRDYIICDYKNLPIIINNQPLNALDINDNSLFVDKYFFGLSIKFVYIFLGK